MCLVCTNVTQVLQHLFLRSPSNVLLMMSLTLVWSPGAAQEALETQTQIWLEIAVRSLGAREPGLQLLRCDDQHLAPGLVSRVSRGHSRVCHHIRRPQPGWSTSNSLWSDPF